MKLTTIKSLVAAALCAVGLSSFAAEPKGVQLWEGGPYWAKDNVGTSEDPNHPEYGALYTFDNAGSAVRTLLGPTWRLPSTNDFAKLISDEYCTKTWDSEKKGYRFTGKTAGYTDKSIFFPFAGFYYFGSRYNPEQCGDYWALEALDDGHAWDLDFFVGYEPSISYFGRGSGVGMSVRAVCDALPVTVGEVASGEPWSTITVNYTLAGVDAKILYKVVFDVTAGGQTASVTNDAAKLTDGAQEPKVIDTVQLFGKQVADTKAKVEITLIAVKPKADQGGVQLWKGGPYFAECNVGATVPGDYGDLYTSKDDKAKNAAESLGAGWRLPTKDELWDLVQNCTSICETCKDSNGAEIKGVRFTGNTDGYTCKSIFLPIAGYDEDGTGREYAGDSGRYWTSDVTDDYGAYFFVISDDGYASVGHYGNRSSGYSVRAVR